MHSDGLAYKIEIQQNRAQHKNMEHSPAPFEFSNHPRQDFRYVEVTPTSYIRGRNMDANCNRRECIENVGEKNYTQNIRTNDGK
jgi:hypothetical protein